MQISSEAKELLESAKEVSCKCHATVGEVLQAQMTAALTTIVDAAMEERTAARDPVSEAPDTPLARAEAAAAARAKAAAADKATTPDAPTAGGRV